MNPELTSPLLLPQQSPFDQYAATSPKLDEKQCFRDSVLNKLRTQRASIDLGTQAFDASADNLHSQHLINDHLRYAYTDSGLPTIPDDCVLASPMPNVCMEQFNPRRCLDNIDRHVRIIERYDPLSGRMQTQFEPINAHVSIESHGRNNLPQPVPNRERAKAVEARAAIYTDDLRRRVLENNVMNRLLELQGQRK